MSLGHLRSLVFTIPAATMATIVMITAAVVSSILTPAAAWQRFWYRSWASIVLRIVGARVSVRGVEKLDPGANYVIVSNHLSLMDIPVLLGGLPVHFKFLAKRELLRVPFIGWYIRRAGHLTVDRHSLRSAIESTNECARLIREHRLSVLIFPEGTRGPGELRPFKDGASYLAIQSGVPLAPVAIVGTEKVLPAKSSYFRPGSVEVRIGTPVSAAGCSNKDRQKLTRQLEDAVKELISG